jgi:hypothetical protein
MQKADKRLAFVVAVAIKWFGPICVSLVISRVIYKSWLGAFSFYRDLLGFGLFSIVFCLLVGCIVGLWMSRADG